jgi:hypothetical protein
MTKNDITRKLKKAGFDTKKNMTIEADEVTVCVGYREIDNNGHKFGVCDEEKTERLANAVRTALGWKGGFRTGYGAQVVIPGASGIDIDNCL